MKTKQKWLTLKLCVMSHDTQFVITSNKTKKGSHSPIASISSMKMMAGARFLAVTNLLTCAKHRFSVHQSLFTSLLSRACLCTDTQALGMIYVSNVRCCYEPVETHKHTSINININILNIRMHCLCNHWWCACCTQLFAGCSTNHHTMHMAICITPLTKLCTRSQVVDSCSCYALKTSTHTHAQTRSQTYTNTHTHSQIVHSCGCYAGKHLHEFRAHGAVSGRVRCTVIRLLDKNTECFREYGWLMDAQTQGPQSCKELTVRCIDENKLMLGVQRWRAR